MGIWKDLLSGKRDDSEDDLDMNSRRIETNEDEIEDLREIRDETPYSNYEARDEIDYKIEKHENRLDYLRERRDELHETNYEIDNDSDDADYDDEY